MKYLVFDTKAAAEKAQADVSKQMGLSKKSINAATLLEEDILTTKWANVVEMEDGKWGFISPDESGVDAKVKQVNYEL